MVYTDKDKEKFEKATKCHICEGPLPNGSTKIDHLAKMGKWLKTMGLKRCMPKFKDVENKKNYFEHITDEEFKKAKIKLLEYLKNNNITV